VQTGVKSFGCENRIAQESPIQSWNRIRPSEFPPQNPVLYRQFSFVFLLYLFGRDFAQSQTESQYRCVQRRFFKKRENTRDQFV